VRNLPGGDRTVLAGGNMTFTGIAPGTLATITAQPSGLCKLDHWMIDGVRNPSNPNVTPAQTIYLTINRDRAVIAVCANVPPVTLTVTTDSFCCPIIVSYSGGGGTVSPGIPRTFTGIVPGTLVTLSWQSGQECWFYDWTIDGVVQPYPEMGWQITMNINHTVGVVCGQYLVP
jgi:hypothetical protein